MLHIASVNKQYNLVPANGRWRLAAGKVWLRTGHVSQTLVVLHLQAEGLEEADEHPPTLCCGVWLTLPFI